MVPPCCVHPGQARCNRGLGPLPRSRGALLRLAHNRVPNLAAPHPLARPREDSSLASLFPDWFYSYTRPMVRWGVVATGIGFARIVRDCGNRQRREASTILNAPRILVGPTSSCGRSATIRRARAPGSLIPIRTGSLSFRGSPATYICVMNRLKPRPDTAKWMCGLRPGYGTGLIVRN